jgi:PAS domain S-box-containing protein
MGEEKIKVLLIDDNKDNYSLIGYLLASTHKPYRIDHADNFVRGTDQAKRGDHDVYLVDDKLSPGRGERIIEKLADKTKKPFILLTKGLNKEKVESGRKVGALDVLDKNNLTSEVLDKAIQYAIAINELEDIKSQTNLVHSKVANLKLLTRVGSLMASGVNYKETLKKVTRQLVDEIADWCLFVVADNKSNIVIAEHVIAGMRESLTTWAEEYPADKHLNKWLYSVMKTGKPALLSVCDSHFIKKVATNTKEAELLRSFGLASCIVAPISLRNSTVGLFVLASAASGRYSKEELALAREIALRAGFAVDRTWLVAKARQSEEIFKRLVQTNTIGIALIKENGEVLGANKAILDMLGYKREEVVGTGFDWRSIYPKEQLPLLEEAKEELFRTGVITTKEREFVRKDGSRIPVLVGSVLINREKTTTLSLVVDITHRKEVEKQKDEFISMASHELKTPLTSQKLFIQIMRKGLEKGESREMLVNKLDKINEQSDKLVNLVNDLLDVSKMEAGRLVMRTDHHDLNKVVLESVDMYKQTSGRNILLKGKLKSKVYCDPDRIGQVVSNLISNAIKYSGNDSKIIVRLKETDKDVEFRVRDFGVGIASESQESIFKRYYRVENTGKLYPGFGLGLYISNEIITAHKGRIWFKSIKGKGSRFCFSLPKQ